jgi:hypothetical protein
LAGKKIVDVHEDCRPAEPRGQRIAYPTRITWRIVASVADEYLGH